MRSWLALPVLAACWLMLGAADYYARVPLKSPAYTDLTALNKAGLLSEWQGPKYALLRLEIAMLLQGALPKYYDELDNGPAPTADAASAMQRLTHEYTDELSGLGVDVRSPLTARPPGTASPPSKPSAEPPVKITYDPVGTHEDDASTTDVPAPAPPPVELPRGEVMLEVNHGADQAQQPGAWSEAAPAESAAAPPKVEDSAVRESVVTPPPPVKQVKAPAKPGKTPVKQVKAPTKPAHTASETPVLVKPTPTGPDHAVRPPASESTRSAVDISPAPVTMPAETPRPVPAIVAAAPLAVPGPSAVPAPAFGDGPHVRQPGGPFEEVPADRDVNMLLSRRSEQLGTTTAASVEHTDVMPRYAVEDEGLQPGPVHFDNLPQNVKIFGDLRGQAYWRDTGLPVGTSHGAGLRLYWGDAGVDYARQQWTARFKLNYNDGSRQVKLHELWARYQNADGVFAQAGRVILPFADRAGDFPTFSAAHQLGFTSANAAGIGWNKPDWGASVWVYDAHSSGAASGTTNLNQFALSLSLLHADCDDQSNGWRVALAYLSDLTGAEHKLAGGLAGGSVPGMNLQGGYDWGCGQYHVNLDYTAATHGFAAGALDANGDGVGDRPRALSLALLYTPEHDTMYGLRFEHTTGMAGSAANRWSAMYGHWLSEQLLGRLEVSRGLYNDYTPGKRHDLGITADIRLVF